MSDNEISESASEWWSKNVIKLKFDNGDSSIKGLFANTLMQSLAKEITEEQLSQFKLKLKTYI